MDGRVWPGGAPSPGHRRPGRDARGIAARPLWGLGNLSKQEKHLLEMVEVLPRDDAVAIPLDPQALELADAAERVLDRPTPATVLLEGLRQTAWTVHPMLMVRDVRKAWASLLRNAPLQMGTATEADPLVAGNPGGKRPLSKAPVPQDCRIRQVMRLCRGARSDPPLSWSIQFPTFRSRKRRFFPEACLRPAAFRKIL